MLRLIEQRNRRVRCGRSGKAARVQARQPGSDQPGENEHQRMQVISDVRIGQTGMRYPATAGQHAATWFRSPRNAEPRTRQPAEFTAL